MSDEKEILALADALNFRRLYHPFNLPGDAQLDYWIVDEQFMPKEGEYQNEIRTALLILKPKAAERAKCRETIRYAIGTVNRAEAEQEILSPRSKKAEQALEKLTAALKRAQAAHKQLPPFERIRFNKVCDLAAAVTFSEERKREWKKTPIPKARTSHRQRTAVEMAYKSVQIWLVMKMGLHEAVYLTGKNPWHRLSAVLFGDEKIDLLSHMTRYQQRLSREPGGK